MERLHVRIALAFCLLLLPFLGATVWWADRQARVALEAELGARLEALAALVAAQLEAQGDHRRLQRLTPAAGNTRRRLHEQLLAQRDASGVRSVRVLSVAMETLVSDVWSEDFGQEFVLAVDREDVRRVLEQRRPQSSAFFEATDGIRVKRGYAPITVDGAVVGVIVVEGGTDAFALWDAARRALLVLLLVALSLAIVVTWAVARRIAAPLATLERAARGMGRGSLKRPVPSVGGGEVGTLAEALETMRAALAAREERMQMMLAGIAHEIRNPLAGIGLHLELLAEEGSGWPEEQRRLLGSARAEVDHLNVIVGDFLAWARERPMRRQRFLLRDLLERAAQAAQPEATRRGVHLSVQGEGAAVEVVGDADALEAALLNVLLNALQASKPEGVVWLSASSRRGEVAVEVVDEGGGIDPAVVPRLTEPFFTTKEQGSGLGLPLARKTMEGHEGRLVLDNRVGVGVRVVLAWPDDLPGPGERVEGSPDPEPDGAGQEGASGGPRVGREGAGADAAADTLEDDIMIG